MPARTVIAIGAHPDDIEFYMAGTLVLLRHAGYEAHYLSLASGNCGSTTCNGPTTRRMRQKEARAAAAVLGAGFHHCLTDDLEILYSLELLRGLAAVIREVKPTIVLTHSPQDYMEDHMITSRLATTAAFARGMPNFKTAPPRAVGDYDVTVYHGMPHGLRDGLRRRVTPGSFVNTTSVQKIKAEALSAHRSQLGWLQTSQGLNSLVATMEHMAREVGRMSRRFKFAEGWRRHSHLGFSGTDTDPLATALGSNYHVSRAYERNLNREWPQ